MPTPFKPLVVLIGLRAHVISSRTRDGQPRGSLLRPTGMLLDALATDVRFAVRRLARTPIFTLAVVAVLALGIGANAAVFTAFDQTVIRPLPFREPARLGGLREDFSAFGRAPPQRRS